jgi:AraC-like DNA-binding protein
MGRPAKPNCRCRQFRIVFGTSPHRYLLMRRLEIARDRIHRGRRLVDVAYDAGYADQAHFTRAFKSAFGLTRAHYRVLRAGQRSPNKRIQPTARGSRP